MNLTNYGQDLATYQIFATLRPAISPYAQLPGDPQIKVTAIQQNTLTVNWMPVRTEASPQQHITYCVEYHREDAAHPADIHASQCAFHRRRPTTQKAGCSPSLSRVLRNLEPNTMYKINVYAKNIVSNTETAYLGAKVRTATEPIPMANAAVMTKTLAPLSTAVYQLSVNREQAMKVMVSPCQEKVTWGILNAQGRPVQTFKPPYDPVTAPRGAQRPNLFGAGPGSQPRIPGIAGQYMRGYRRGSLSLPDLELLTSPKQQRSIIGVMVKNHAPRPAKFELHATSAGRSAAYPELPSNKRVRVIRTTLDAIEINWDRVPFGRNITYCVLVYPSEQSRINGVVHSTCSYKEVEKRNKYQPGACSRENARRLSNLQPNSWYDIDVVAKNVYSQKIKAYSSVRAYTSSGNSAACLEKFGALLFLIQSLLVTYLVRSH